MINKGVFGTEINSLEGVFEAVGTEETTYGLIDHMSAIHALRKNLHEQNSVKIVDSLPNKIVFGMKIADNTESCLISNVMKRRRIARTIFRNMSYKYLDVSNL